MKSLSCFTGLLVAAALIASCDKDVGLANVETLPIELTGEHTAKSGGVIHYEGDGGAVSHAGVVWSYIGSPTINHNDGITDDHSGPGSYDSFFDFHSASPREVIVSVEENGVRWHETVLAITIYVKAYARQSQGGVSYGDVEYLIIILDADE